MSSRLALFFAAGYLPPLIAAHHDMQAFAVDHVDDADPEMARIADEEIDRLQLSGLLELMQQRLLRLERIGDALGVTIPGEPDDAEGCIAWQRQIEGILQELGATDQADAMAYTLGLHIGEVIRLINRQAYLVRYQLVADPPILANQWVSIARELPVRLQHLLTAAAFAGLPPILRELGQPYAKVVNDVVVFPRRHDDKLYLVLLGRNLQNEMYSLLDQIDATEEKLKHRAG
ncbi:MAG: hypothetical protein H7338_23000 [Candidatus Sericytochromatia bacterium]|nr:hypothetical protein [Candidatus Sericytochromatia bacterium]